MQGSMFRCIWRTVKYVSLSMFNKRVFVGKVYLGANQHITLAQGFSNSRKISKHGLLGSILPVSDSGGMGGTQECTFLGSSQVLLMLPGQGPYPEPQIR